MKNKEDSSIDKSIWEIIDEKEDPSFPQKIERLFYKIGYFFKNLYYNTIYLFQKIIRPHHTSDIELWNLDSALAKYLYKKIKAFSDMERHGYPSYFTEYNENEWESKEEYGEAVKKGKIGSGSYEAWNKTLDKILLALEYSIHVKDSIGETKKANEWYKKYGFKNPHAKIPENLHTDYEYRMLPAYIKEQEKLPNIKKFGGLSPYCISSKKDLHIENPEKYELIKERQHYYDVRYDIEVIQANVDEGYMLLGKHFQSLWD